MTYNKFHFPISLILLTVSVVWMPLGCQSVKLPVVMNDNPSLAELAQAVNTNSAKIQSLRSDNATLGLSNASGWANGNVAFQRPRNVRLIATAAMVGRVVDFGSNDEKFWYWSKYQNPEQIYWAKNSEYATSPLKETIPVDPVWFPEALGVVEINTSDVIEGPVVQADKTLLLVTQRQQGNETFKKYTYIEPKTAAIKRQDVIAPSGETVVSVVCNEFQVDEATQAVLPKKLVITCPKSPGAIQIDLGTLRVNPTEAVYAQLFQMPTNEDVGATPVDIGSGTIPTAAPAAQTTSNPATASTASTDPAASTAQNPPPMVAPPASSTASTASQTAETAPPMVAPSAAGAGTGSSGNEISYQVNQTEIPSSTDVSSNGTAVSASFRTNATPNEEQYLNNSQSYFVPPVN